MDDLPSGSSRRGLADPARSGAVGSRLDLRVVRDGVPEQRHLRGIAGSGRTKRWQGMAYSLEA